MTAKAAKLRVIVFEDDELDRLIIGKAIDGTGLCSTVVFAEDAEAGLKLIKEKKYDCIFLDYNLPGTNGLRLLKKIRDDGINTPLVVITSQGDERIAVDMMKNGAADYIPKSLLTTEGITHVLRHIFRIQEFAYEKIHYEFASQSTQKTLHAVAANAPVILFSFDNSGCITMFEGKSTYLFGNDKNDFIGKEISTVEHKLPFTKLSFNKAAAGADVKEAVERLDNSFEVFYSPMRNQAGVITGVMGVASEIPDHRKEEAQLVTEKRIAGEATRVRQEFLANLSHEIRTPMSGIIGLADILSRTKITNEQRRYLKSITDCSENLLLIINDILDLSKIEAGKMTFEKTPFSLKETIATCFSIFEAQAAEKNIELKWSVHRSVPEIVIGDYVRLSQVFNNLIGNAVKFTPEGMVSLSVNCLSDIADNLTLIFKLKDTGIGIAPEKQKLVFDSFTQAGSDTTRRFGGTGLGLAIVKKLLELQGGSIRVDSEEGKGSEFTFTLGFGKATSEETRTVKKTSSQNLTADLSSMNILAAEDNEMSRMIMEKHFAGWKANFRFAENGTEAVELARQTDFDIVLMDIQMPGMDGYEAARIIRNLTPSAKASVPIVAVTAHASDTERVKCMNHGMNDYLSKPYRAEELLFKITENCSNKKISLSVNTKAERKTEFTMEETNSIIDLQYLKRVANDEPDFIRDMISIFFKRTPESVSMVKQALAEGNVELVWQTAHRMKPSFSYMGMTATSALAAKLEKLYKTEPDPKQAEELLSTIENNFRTAQALIEKEFLVNNQA